MEHHGRHLRLVRPTDEEQIAALKEIVDAEHDGDFRNYIVTRYPHLALRIPNDVTVEQFAHTDGYAPYADRVLTLCSRCPAHGGKCDDGDSTDRLTAPGQQPFWNRETRAVEAQQCDRWAEHMLRVALRSAGVADRLLGARFDNFERTRAVTEAVVLCREYADEFPSPREYADGMWPTNLLLFGEDTGIGKTHLSVAVLAELIRGEKLPRAVFSSVSGLLENIRNSYDSKTTRAVLKRYCITPILVLDDLGAHRVNEWVREQLLVIIDYRWGRGLATIMTTNSDPDVIVESIGERAASRLFGKAIRACLSGDDHRWR
jgi:DNA replication protein DnaC